MYKKNFRIFKTVLLATVLSAAIFSTQAQTQKFAAVGGGVNDANGAAVTGAVVTLTKTEGVSTKMTVISDDAGRFRFERVAFGDYTMTVGKAGFKTARRDAMAIQTENPPDFNMSLEVGSVANSVVVVSVSRIEEELKNAPASISVVTRSEIENREVRSAGYELVGCFALISDHKENNDAIVFSKKVIGVDRNRYWDFLLMALLITGMMAFPFIILMDQFTYGSHLYGFHRLSTLANGMKYVALYFSCVYILLFNHRVYQMFKKYFPAS